MKPGGRLAVIAWLLAGAAVVPLAACNQAGRPPRGATGDSVGEAVDLGGGPYTVVPGDRVYLIARSLRVPIRELIEANGLTPPFRLVPGQILTIPPRSEYLVQPGDTVYGLARRFGVDQSSLIRLNDIGAPEYIIRIGQRLLIPSRVRKLAGATTVAGTLAPSNPTSPTSPTSPSSPSSGGAIEAVELAPVILTPAPTALTPPPTPEAPAATTPDTLPETVEAVPTPEAALEPAPLDTAVDGGGVDGGAKFLWPVNGKVISRFGAKTGGLVNDGLNIAAPLGAPVRAAESGVVAYIGNELQGFGNLVLIRHADGWMSAYAHNETLLVKRGEQVKRGQTIARVGQTGSVTEPQLHFELRRGTEAVNPVPLLDRRSS
jgi:murein DD-endopeptidase MepM/ murein hydrolase activator NlpD